MSVRRLRRALILGVPDVAPLITQAFNNVVELLKRVPNAKKPDTKELLAFLGSGSDAISKADNLRYRGKDLKKWGDYYKACYEVIVIIQWVTMVPPAGSPLGHCDQQSQACDFNLNRVVKEAKDDKTKVFVAALKKVCKTQTEFVKEHFKTGITWNPKGESLGNATAASVSTTTKGAHAEEHKEPPKETKTAPKEEKGMNAIFGELSQGLEVTKGLKKVTTDMKSKNRTDRSGKVTETAKKTGPKREKGAATIRFIGGRWMAENFNEGEHTIDKADMKSNVYISMCDDARFIVPGKVKSITVDSCVKCDVIIQEVISTVEVVNSKSVTLWLQDKTPSVAVDKTQSARVVLSKKAFDAAPDIYTSNITAMNIEIPGVDEKADNVEIPIPEQFLTKINPQSRAVDTIQVKHG
jgi:adenylyl cyclase-associated protein